MSLRGNDAVALGRSLAQAFASRAFDANRTGQLPADDIDQLRQSGFLALTVPRIYGGAGLGMADTVQAQFELAQGSPSTAIVVAMQLHIFAHARETLPWSATHMDQFCSAVVEDGALFNAVASEPALGSPSRGYLFQTRAVLSEDGQQYVITGHKNWVTGGRYLTHMLVRLDAEGESADLLVEHDRPGLRWEHTWQHALSLRASESDDLFFDGVKVPVGNLVTRHVPGVKSPANVWFPMLLSATYLGAAMGARNRVVRYALERVPSALGKPIATLPKIQRQIGAIDYKLQAARALLLEVAREWDTTDPGDAAQRQAFLPRMAAAKYNVTETAATVTDEALRVAGGASLSDALPLEQYFRDVRAGLMQPPSGDTALELIGRSAIDSAAPEASQ